MAWLVVWTEPAWETLEAASDYIAQDSPRCATALIREAREAVKSLRHTAELMAGRPEWAESMRAIPEASGFLQLRG